MGGAFKPARDMLSRGKTELLLGMGIVKKLDLAVNFENNQFKFGQCEWEMMTFNEKHRWAFPLVPTACGYAKLNEYFGKLRDEKSKFRNSGAILAIIYQFGKFCGWRNNE